MFECQIIVCILCIMSFVMWVHMITYSIKVKFILTLKNGNVDVDYFGRKQKTVLFRLIDFFMV